MEQVFLDQRRKFTGLAAALEFGVKTCARGSVLDDCLESLPKVGIFQRLRAQRANRPARFIQTCTCEIACALEMMKGVLLVALGRRVVGRLQLNDQDRKSTRLNSSHMSISYAVF